MELGPGEEVAERDDAVAARRRHRALLGANRLPQLGLGLGLGLQLGASRLRELGTREVTPPG